MNREILFRGKRVDNGEWIEGWIYWITKGGYLLPIENECYITTFKKIDNGEILLTGSYEVDPDTVSQYTGLTDKNGAKIFEDDIMECGYVSELTKEYISKKQLIENEKGVYWGRLIGHSPFGDTFLMFCNKRGQIIGNVHDNPELLEVQHG